MRGELFARVVTRTVTIVAAARVLFYPLFRSGTRTPRPQLDIEHARRPITRTLDEPNRAAAYMSLTLGTARAPITPMP